MADAKTKFGIGSAASFKTLVITQDGTFTKPTDTDLIWISACGGGGGGRSYLSSPPYDGSGGGGAGGMIGWMPIYDDVIITVGAGGVLGASPTAGTDTILEMGPTQIFKLSAGLIGGSQLWGGTGGTVQTGVRLESGTINYGEVLTDQSDDTLGGVAPASSSTGGHGKSKISGSLTFFGGGSGAGNTTLNSGNSIFGGSVPGYTWSARGYGGGGGSLQTGARPGQSTSYSDAGYGGGGSAWGGVSGNGVVIIGAETKDGLVFTPV